MKKIFIAFLFISSYLVYAQIDECDFFPLKVGNTWIYSAGVGSVKVKINGTVNANNHIYYTFVVSGNLSSCAQGTCYPMLVSLVNPLRVDSVTGNIFELYTGNTCPWYSGEIIIDSLKMKTGNLINNSCFFSSCYDTNNVIVFGVNRRTKNLGQPVMTYSTQKRYVYGLGIYSTARGCFYSSCGSTLNGCVINGTVYGDTSFLTGISLINNEIPEKFSLNQNYPNPFNPSTHIIFNLPVESFVKLTVFEMLGKEVQVLINAGLQPGTYEADWDASANPSGVYYYKLESGSFSETKKMVLIK